MISLLWLSRRIYDAEQSTMYRLHRLVRGTLSKPSKGAYKLHPMRFDHFLQKTHTKVPNISLFSLPVHEPLRLNWSINTEED